MIEVRGVREVQGLKDLLPSPDGSIRVVTSLLGGGVPKGVGITV